MNYDETFAPVASMETVRIGFAIVAHLDLNVYQFDVQTAFLNGKLKEEIYMRVPKGISNQAGKVCKLDRAIYGLKQACRTFNAHLNSPLEAMGFERSNVDPCLYKRINSGQYMLSLIHI